MKTKLRVMWTLLFAKKFMVILGEADTLHVVTTYPEKEISRSGKAIYIH